MQDEERRLVREGSDFFFFFLEIVALCFTDFERKMTWVANFVEAKAPLLSAVCNMLNLKVFLKYNSSEP